LEAETRLRGNQMVRSPCRVSTDIAEVFRKAEPSHLLEPELATLRRQIKAALTDRLGYDADNEPLVMEVVIPRCKQYRADL